MQTYLLCLLYMSLAAAAPIAPLRWEQRLAQWSMALDDNRSIQFSSPGYVYEALEAMHLVQNAEYRCAQTCVYRGRGYFMFASEYFKRLDYCRFAERDERWVREREWKLFCTAQLPSDAPGPGVLELELDGVDGPAHLNVTTSCGQSAHSSWASSHRYDLQQRGRFCDPSSSVL